jgi:hypothetical protein
MIVQTDVELPVDTSPPTAQLHGMCNSKFIFKIKTNLLSTPFLKNWQAGLFVLHLLLFKLEQCRSQLAFHEPEKGQRIVTKGNRAGAKLSAIKERLALDIVGSLLSKARSKQIVLLPTMR